MCKLISFLSGKGGSGKTTLALSIASMLSRCGIKVLLIDCDLSTNGATYFYEDRISEEKENLVSFADFLQRTSSLNSGRFISIENNFDFMPSITQITQNDTYHYLQHQNDNNDIFLSLHNLREKYDVVLFDCQAGYTNLLQHILPCVDINLIVMEADAISSAALRSLFLKIGHLIKKKKVYQVFNKVGEEEYATYSKVSGGTLFTSIESIHFDWKIRKAFAVSQIPDMENTSANYGEQILSICSILFRDSHIKKKLGLFRSILDYHKTVEEENQIQANLNHLLQNYSKQRNEFLFTFLFPLALLVPILILFTIVLPSVITRKEDLVPVLVALCFLFFIVGSLLTDSRHSCSTFFSTVKQKQQYQQVLANIRTKKKRLMRKISSTNQLTEKVPPPPPTNSTNTQK